MNKDNIIGAIEMGTAKVVVAIGEIIDGASLNIIGVGESPSQGIMKGEVVDFQAACTVTHAAILAAESKAGVNLSSAFLAQTGYHLQGFLNESSVNIGSSDSSVMQDDIERVTKDAKNKQLPAERVYIHHIQNPFKLDGRIITNPLNIQGQKLQVGYWSVHGDLRKVRDNIHVVNSFGIKVEDVIISSIASGSMVADQTEKMNGILVIDIGRGTTDYAVYRGGYVTQTGVIPIGGDHITNDISLGLRLDRNQCEIIKKQNLYSNMEDVQDTFTINAENSFVPRNINKNAVIQIIEARMKELFSFVRKQIEVDFRLKDLAAGIVLTGGCSRLSHIDRIAKEVFEVDARLGDNPPWACESLRDPEYSTVLGLLHYALRSQEKKGILKVQKPGILNKVAKMFNNLSLG